MTERQGRQIFVEFMAHQHRARERIDLKHLTLHAIGIEGGPRHATILDQAAERDHNARAIPRKNHLVRFDAARTPDGALCARL